MYDGNSKAVKISIAASASFHVLLFGLYYYFVLMRPETRNVVLSNVDLIMQEKEAQAKPENKTLSFLKLALPVIPKIAVQEVPKIPTLDIKTPDRHRPAMDLPKTLAERSGRVSAAQKLEMDAGRRVGGDIKDAGLDIKAERSAQAMAPRIELEEVGMKKAPSLPQGLKFEDAGPAVRPQTMQELNMAVGRARRAGTGPQALAERQGAVAAARQTPAIAAAPQRLTEAQSGGVQVARRQAPAISAAAFTPRHNESLRGADAAPRRMEITGPLSRRKVSKYYVPAFPDWARDRGILEAAVSVKFYVDNSGRVLDSAEVEKTSGYGALDRLALDAIKRWSFEPLAGPASRQWGIITFRFLAD
ncbi:MAG: energy transducer TonB [Elusimicrobiales bacterium]|nr:energy transducer TonB [Elusimicrobiales bacterium]